MEDCPDCNQLKALYILMALMCEFFKKDDKAIISNYHTNKHKLFTK